MRFSIYSKDGSTIRYTGKPKYNGTYLKTPYLEFSEIASPVKIDWEIGDYVDYPRTGLRYKLYSIPQPKKNARTSTYGAAYTYSNVQLYDATKELEIALFQDLVLDVEKNVHFSTRDNVSTYEDVYGIAARLQASMDAFYPSKWLFKVMALDDDADKDLKELLQTAKEFSLSNGTVLGALNNIYNTWEGIGWIHYYDSSLDRDVVLIGRPNKRDSTNTTSQFVYGLGKGLTAIKKSYTNTDEFATRLYVYGSDKNLPTRYYNGKSICNAESVDIPNLMLPQSCWRTAVDPATGQTLPDASLCYIEDSSLVDKYGLIPRRVYFNGSDNDEIYPTIKNITAKRLRDAKAEMGDTEYVPSVSLYPDEERMDKVKDCDNPQDDGIEVEEGEFKGEETKDVSILEFVRFIGASDDNKKYSPDTYKTPIVYDLLEFDTAYKTNRVVINPTLKFKVTLEPEYSSSGSGTTSGSATGSGTTSSSSKSDSDGDTSASSGDIPVIYQRVTAYMRQPDGTIVEDVQADTKLSPEAVTVTRQGTIVKYLYWNVEMKDEYVINEAGVIEKIKVTLVFDRTYDTKTGLKYSVDTATGSIYFGYRDDLANTFALYIKQIGFDLSKCTSTASSGIATISMLDGMCGGRSFAVKKCIYLPDTDSWMLTLKRVSDTSVNMIYPNKNFPILTGDQFVLLDIVMPELYIKIAEQTLYEAASALYAEISKGKSYYEPEIDAKQIYLSGEKIKEGMYMQIADADIVDDGVDYILIDTLQISEDESNIPTYKVTLREKKKSTVVDSTTTALKDLTTEFHASYGGNGIGNLINSMSDKVPADDNAFSALRAQMEFLSKKYDDVASGLITLAKGAQFGKGFATGVNGFGGMIDENGNAELDSLVLRKFLEVPELRYNRISIQVGNSWRAPGGGIIDSVEPDFASDGSMLNTGTIYLHLEDGEIGYVALDDICMGIYHDALRVDSNALVDSDDGIGNFKFTGFYTCYFRVTEILADDNSSFRYAIRPASESWPTTYHPCSAMHFVCYGNFSDKDRQASRYSTRRYERYLKDVASWEFTASNIGAQFGDLANLKLFDIDMTGYSAYLDNIYMSGTIKQFDLLPYRMEIDNNGMDALAYGESMTVVCSVYKGFDDVTTKVAKWKIVRDSGDPTEDEAWNNSSKAQNFAGVIVIEHFKNYSDLGQIGVSTLFTITADMTDGSTTDYTLEI